MRSGNPDITLRPVKKGSRVWGALRPPHGFAENEKAPAKNGCPSYRPNYQLYEGELGESPVLVLL